MAGDILGAAVSDLHSLLELPTGCGEQNMAKLVPNIVLMEYLKVSAGPLEAALGILRFVRQVNFDLSPFHDFDQEKSSKMSVGI